MVCFHISFAVTRFVFTSPVILVVSFISFFFFFLCGIHTYLQYMVCVMAVIAKSSALCPDVWAGQIYIIFELFSQAVVLNF